MFLLRKLEKGFLQLSPWSPETSFSSLFNPTNSWQKYAKVHSNLNRAILFFTIVFFSLTVVRHTTVSMFHVISNEVNENLKAHIPSNSIYQHKTNINKWAGVQWDIDSHVGT